ncbi:hypothetical protein AAEO57_10285, partial [Flavobacterium sp. DGU38]
FQSKIQVGLISIALYTNPILCFFLQISEYLIIVPQVLFLIRFPVSHTALGMEAASFCEKLLFV